MATLRKRGQRWQVQVRRTNHPTRTATFDTRREAEAWARRIETGLDALFGGQCPRDPRRLLLAALVWRHLTDELPKKRSTRRALYSAGVSADTPCIGFLKTY